VAEPEPEEEEEPEVEGRYEIDGVVYLDCKVRNKSRSG
jgi:hypothetical protein